MKQSSTLFLKVALFIIGTPILVLAVFGLVQLCRFPASPDYDQILYPIVLGVYLSTIPFYAALHQAFRLLVYIDRNEAFSELSVKALGNIKKCAAVICAVYLLLEPFVFQVAELDDAPGLAIMGMVPVFVSMVIAVFAAVLQKLLQEAINLKSENDLTV